MSTAAAGGAELGAHTVQAGRPDVGHDQLVVGVEADRRGAQRRLLEPAIVHGTTLARSGHGREHHARDRGHVDSTHDSHDGLLVSLAERAQSHHTAPCY